jgi:U3 small nucleolar ribonucleoprotein protein IMP4
VILLTTSRRPTGRIRTFCRDFVSSIPDVVRVNRGKMSLDGVAERAIELEADRVVVVDRWRGGLGRINLFRVSSTGLKSVPPLMLISMIRLRREFEEGTRRARSSAITLKPEDSAELIRITGRLSQYFGLPVLSVDEAVRKHGASMHFSFDSSRRLQITFMLLQRMVEIGPRVTLSKLVWEVPS